MTISNQHRYYARFTDQWDKVMHCLQGEDVIKEQGSRYLPQPSAMDINMYNSYKQRASFYSVAERTLRGMTGMIFRKDPVVKLPSVLDPMVKSCSNEAMPLQMFIEEVTREVISMGRYGVLLDMPRSATVGTTPHFVPYTAVNITNWQEEFINGMKVLTSLTVRDSVFGDYSIEKESWMELSLIDGIYNAKRYEIALDADGRRLPVQVEHTVPFINGKPLNFIPFVFFNPYDLRPEPSKPPFIDLCNMNLAHYRNSADYEHALFLTAQPTPWIAGTITEADKPRSIGSGTIWYLEENAKAGMLEFTGKGLEAQRMAMQDKEDRMASLGARMIKDSTRVQEKAETARLRARGETSLVLDSLQTVEMGIELLLRWAADWMAGDMNEVEIVLNRDFVDARLDANMLMAIVKTWQLGAISRDTMHDNLQQGEIMRMDRTAEEEKDLIDDEGEMLQDDDFGLGSESIDIVPELPADAR